MENEQTKQTLANSKLLGQELKTKLQKGKDVEFYGFNFEDYLSLIGGVMMSPLFDVYTLARMIRFDMKRVIIYAGAAHTNRMKQFLVNKMGFKVAVSRKSDKEGSESFQCIDLKGVPQPWFT